ncbi:hypothetical protein QP179_09435 [Sphingomonas aurantiaca]
MVPELFGGVSSRVVMTELARLEVAMAGGNLAERASLSDARGRPGTSSTRSTGCSIVRSSPSRR